MPTMTIPIDRPTAITQNIVYAIPPISVEVQTTNALQSSLFVDTGFSSFAAAIITGCFIRCTVGNATVTLRKNAVG